MVWFNNVVEVFTQLNFYRRVAFFILKPRSQQYWNRSDLY